MQRVATQAGMKYSKVGTADHSNDAAWQSRVFQPNFPHNAIEIIEAFLQTLILSRIVPDYHRHALLKVDGWISLTTEGS